MDYSWLPIFSSQFLFFWLSNAYSIPYGFYKPLLICHFKVLSTGGLDSDILFAEAHNHSDSFALTANFTFVARDPKTGKSAPINQISVETEREKLLWEEAEERNKLRKQMKELKRGSEKTDEDSSRLHALLSEGRVFCDMPALADRDSILIRDTCCENSLICQPQQRNIHGRIFGGFLMRRALELASSTTYAFAGAAPQFVEVDHVDFLKPVSID